MVFARFCHDKNIINSLASNVFRNNKCTQSLSLNNTRLQPFIVLYEKKVKLYFSLNIRLLV